MGSKFGKDLLSRQKMGKAPCLESMSTWSLSSSDTKVLCAQESSSVGSGFVHQSSYTCT